MSPRTSDESKTSQVITQSKTAPLTNQVTDATPQDNTSTSAANASSHKQLLDLAKKFALDGAFLPPEKQAPLEDRSHRRIRLSELRKQQNIEAIIARSVQYCSDSRIADRADRDWFSAFIDLAEDISNNTMQELWAKILAGEVSKPGTFSLKTLQAFRTMSINEAKLFAKACSLAVNDTKKRNIRIITGAYQIPQLFNFFNKQREQRLDLNHFGFSYADVLSLADNHLLFQQETESNSFNKNEKIHFIYNGQPLTISARKSDSLLTFYKFTPIGTELAFLIAENPDSDYFNALKTQLNENFSITG